MIVILLLLAGVGYFNPVRAQHVYVQANIGVQPLWGPAGYDYVEYYYLPELDVFYYVPGQEFVYWNGFTWVFTPVLPAWYGRYDLYTTYKVVINTPRPYLHHTVYVNRYSAYRYHPPRQVVIRDSRDPKYYGAQNHGNNTNHYNGRRPSDSKDRGSKHTDHRNRNKDRHRSGGR